MISYNPLWHTLLDRGMNKGDLKDATGLSYGTMASMGKNEPVNLKQIDRICKALSGGRFNNTGKIRAFTGAAHRS